MITDFGPPGGRINSLCLLNLSCFGHLEETNIEGCMFRSKNWIKLGQSSYKRIDPDRRNTCNKL